MAADRFTEVLQAMADAVAEGSPSSADAVCKAAISLLSLKGAGLSLMVDGELRGTVGVSDPGIAKVQELQLSLGQGPCLEAWAERRPVLEPDLAGSSRWPAFATGGLEAGIRAVFAFPLHLGAIRIGVLALYRDRMGTLTADELARGLAVADIATRVVLALQAGAREGSVHELLGQEPPHWAEIHQATGMVSAQLGVTLDEAFVRLRAHAFSHNRPLGTVCVDVVNGRLRLEM